MLFDNEEDIIKAVEAGEEVEFYGWFPLAKSEKAAEEGKRHFSGVASTKDLDLQNEIVHTDGLDFSYFMKHGFFNDDHKPGPENKIGEPTKVELKDGKLHVEGFLYKDHKKADAYWELINALGKSDSKRKVGLSIEGKVKRRNGNQIYSAWIKDIAITCAPVNTNTFVEVMKALNVLNKSKESYESGESPHSREINASSAQAITSESLEKGEPVANSLAFDEAMAWLESNLGVTPRISKAIANYAFKK